MYVLLNPSHYASIMLNAFNPIMLYAGILGLGLTAIVSVYLFGCRQVSTSCEELGQLLQNLWINTPEE